MAITNRDGYLETPAVCRLAGLPSSTLDYWVRSGLVTPSVRGSSGRRVTRRWTIADVVSVRALKELRRAGCPVRLLRKARERLDSEWQPTLRNQLLYWDGRDLLGLGPWDEVVSLVRNPGQGILRLIALPLDTWVAEASGEIIAFSPKPYRSRKSGPARRIPKSEAS